MDTNQRTFPETTTAAGVGADRDKRISGQVSEATSKLTGAARQAGRQAMDQAMDAVSTLSSEATGSVKGILNRQVGAGADVVRQVGEAVKAAADKLDQDAPQLAGVAREAAGKIDTLSTQLSAKSADELFQDASDFARRQPAIVFGGAALVGFALFRLFRAEGSRRDLGPMRHRPASDYDRAPDLDRHRDQWQQRRFPDMSRDEPVSTGSGSGSRGV
jgi:hypothetical protein